MAIQIFDPNAVLLFRSNVAYQSSMGNAVGKLKNSFVYVVHHFCKNLPPVPFLIKVGDSYA